jgi:hypothetical protein
MVDHFDIHDLPDSVRAAQIIIERIACVGRPDEGCAQENASENKSAHDSPLIAYRTKPELRGRSTSVILK